MSEHPSNIGTAHPECGAELVHQDKPLTWFVGKHVKKKFALLAAPRLGHPTHERMWVKVLCVEDDVLVGTLDNDPICACGVAYGDEVRAAQHEIIGVVE